ncbi:hypothetical protein [Halosegnis longus]|uniref:hypothetical protein n=1 Tax=Halosegnis longus TaxID=2216012 RepID=UPI00129D2A35|nr:hypothetical protein [Halosegnis longus]
MADTQYGKLLIQLIFDRTELSALELADLLEEEAQRYRTNGSDAASLQLDGVEPARGQFADTEETTLEAFAGGPHE